MSKVLNRIAPQDEVLLEVDIGTMIPSAEQLAEERVTRFNADKEIRLRVKALEESGSAIEEAKAAAEQASKAAQQAEDAKDAIGDVGERLEAVETSVAQKQPYISQLMLSLFDYKRYDLTVGLAGMFVRAPCHEGFIYYGQYQNTQSRYFGVNGIVIPFPVNARDGFRLTIIGEDETVVYAENNGKYKFTISGRGDAVTITHAVLSEFPESVGAYSYVVGWRTSNGYIVTTNGRILDGTTLAEVATFAFSAGFSYDGAYAKILKRGNTFYYKDTTTHKFTTMTIGDDGVPTLSVNGYVNNIGHAGYFPIGKDTFVVRSKKRVVGITNANGHLYDNTGGDDTFLGVAVKGINRFVFTYNDAYLVSQGETSDGGYQRVRVASNLTMQDDWSLRGLTNERQNFNLVQDGNGNIFVVNFMHYEGPREFVHVFKVKEA